MKEELEQIKQEAIILYNQVLVFKTTPREIGMYVDKNYVLYKYEFTYKDQILNKEQIKDLNNDNKLVLNNFIKENIDKKFENIMIFDAGYNVILNYNDKHNEIINHYSYNDPNCFFTKTKNLLKSFCLISDEQIKKLKKVELHLHLDGSVRKETLYELSKSKDNFEDFKSKVSVSKNCKDLNEYLEKFDLPLKVMQNKKNITRITKELCEDLYKDNVIYAEIRFSPLLHTKRFLSLNKVVEATILGIKDSKVKVNLILCCMRGRKFKDNKKIIDLALKYKNQGVVAVDLAGAEGLYKTSEYEDLFKYAKEKDVSFTIHAGEARGKEEVIKAIELGTKRIGHGIHLENDKNLIEEIINKNIVLEICPTSNIQTKAVENIYYHPIKNYYKQGIKTTINTDNRTVSNITLFDEYKLLRDIFNFGIDDFKNMNINAIEGAFISEEEKNILKKELGE
ncbi:MAG: adenosine deaminase [Bacilli bacterium]